LAKLPISKASGGTEPDSFFVFVLVPWDCSGPPEYFVMNNEQFRLAADKQKQIDREKKKERGKSYVDVGPGINYSTVASFRNAWGNLPA
jgi:hypothetical protein